MAEFEVLYMDVRMQESGTSLSVRPLQVVYSVRGNEKRPNH